MLEAKRVDEIFRDCLFEEDEIENGMPKDPTLLVKIEAVMSTFGLHKGRLEGHRAEVASLLEELPDLFREDKGGGWSFLNACMDKNDRQWGEHSNIEQLFALAIGLGLGKFPLSRENWAMLPGGMPYFVILKETAEV